MNGAGMDEVLSGLAAWQSDRQFSPTSRALKSKLFPMSRHQQNSSHDHVDSSGAGPTCNVLDQPSMEVSSDDKSVNSSRIRRLEYLRRAIDCDCQIHLQHMSVAPDGQSGSVSYRTFDCHRIFLATASEKMETDVFKNAHFNGVLEMDGVSPESVQIFLEYIYTFEVDSPLVALKIIWDIFILSNAFNIPELMSAFFEKVKEQDWPLEDVIPAFDLAFRQCGMPELEHRCLDLIIPNARKLINDGSLMKIQLYSLNYIIQLWMATDAVPRERLVQLLQEYQRANGLNFNNFVTFSHFTKIIQHFPDVLLDAEGSIIQ
ncbi:Hypothetical predicted protein [Drosophila guanche]|uniref:BTB domain-containing protein n=1 Tax=Drosophila guanche TaxID=7266 RepID=A0A3B0KBM9_DROGU|nr:Hypothetical predicted protein [Drosophila guanche]